MTLVDGQKRFSNQVLEYQWLQEPPFLRQKSPNLAWHRSGISAPRAPSRDRRRSVSSICDILLQAGGGSDRAVAPSLNDNEKWVAIIEIWDVTSAIRRRFALCFPWTAANHLRERRPSSPTADRRDRISGRSGSTEQEGHSRLGLVTVASDALIVFG